MKIMDILFVFLFLSIIFVPFIKLDTTEDINSSLENRAMTKWPGIDWTGEHNEWYGHYVEDRVAFRELAIRGYIKGSYALFHEFTEKLHMYGKDEWVFPADRGYIESYQHLATDEELIDNLVTYLSRTNEYLQSKDIKFIFTVGLDKKTVYDQYMPDSIHVDGSKESILEMLSRKLDDAGVEYVIPVSEFKERTKTEQIYNKVYDSAHWNDLGALYGMQLVDDKIRQTYPDIPPLTMDYYKIKYEDKGIEFIELPISDSVPVLSYKKKKKPDLVARYKKVSKLTLVPGTSMLDYFNPNAPSKRRILIIHDSFLENRDEFFTARYREVFMTPRQNYEHLQEYVEALKPDVVLFENAERAFVDDLYAYTELANVSYD